MNLSPVYICFWCLVVTRTTDALPKVIPDLVQKALGGVFGRTSASLDIFHPRFLDLRYKYQKKRGGEGGDCVWRGIEECDPASPYRTHDGRCNNLAHPGWGRTSDCHLRFLEAAYQGESGLRVSVRGGRPLPLPRDITLGLFLDRKRPTRDTNFLFTVFGQMVAHDISDSLPQQASGSCCSLSTNSTLCVPIHIRSDDPFYSQFNVTCISMVRSAPCPHCHNKGKWQQSNTVTAALDGSVIYGSTEDRAWDLRRFDGTGGLVSEMTVHGELLPRPGDKAALPQFCPKNQKKKCFYTGDIRTNQHATLMSIQTLFLREHNRVAEKLGKLNPHWDDETIYQETRKIVGAELQNIVYSEYLLALLGPEHMSHYNLYVQPTDDEEDWDNSYSDKHGIHRSHVRDGGTSYDPDLRFGIWNEFNAAVFRLHSMVPTRVGMDHYRFRDLYSCPQLVRERGVDRILSGASEVPSERNDHWFTKEVSHFLLKQSGVSFGSDLAAIDIQRGRDHGIPPYVTMLGWLSGGRMHVTKFEHLSPLMSETSIQQLRKHYADVRDVDLFTGVLMEHHVRHSNLGPTACAIAARQFHDLKYGDRFYFEHEGEAPSFTPDQRRSLRRSSLSGILCHNTEILTIPRNSLLLESDENPLLTCNQIPKVDLSLWKTSPTT